MEQIVKLTGIQAAQKKLAEMRELGITSARLTPGEKSKASPSSLRMAVTAHCWDCVGGEHSDNARQSVRECTVEKCYLFNVRPWQQSSSASEE